LPIEVACNAGVFWGRENAIATILDFKRRGRLGRVERATKGEGISAMQEYFGGQVNAVGTILDFKRRGRLGRVERATKGEGISLKAP